MGIFNEIFGKRKRGHKDIFLYNEKNQMDVSRALVEAAILNERRGTEFKYNDNDKAVLKELTEELNKKLGTDVHYLCELVYFDITDAGPIMADYLDRFESEGIRVCLLEQMFADNVDDCAKTVLKSYIHFRGSKEFIADQGKPAPSHIYSRYDNLFKKLKPKKLKKELFEIVSDPRNAAYLPLTTRMLASWKMKEMEQVLIRYLGSEKITAKELFIKEKGNYAPSCKEIRRELQKVAIGGLKYFPSEKNVKLVEAFASGEDKELQVIAQKSIEYMQKHKNVDA